MNSVLRLATLAIFAAFLNQAAWAERVFVDPVKGSGVADSDKESVEELIRTSIPQAGRHTVAPKREDADWVLTPTLMKLGDSYILTIQKKDKGGQTLFGEKMKASNLNEMDTVAARLTRAVINQEAAASTADVTNITNDEEHANTRRYNATRQWVLGLGPGWSTNLRSTGGGFTFLFGFLWGLDPDFSVNLSLNTNSGPKSDGSTFTDVSLGGEYYFLRTRNSPFLGARLGYGSARVNHDNCNALSIGCAQDRASGWAGTLTGGYKFFRTSTVNTAVVINYQQIFDKTSLGSPALTSVEFAVYF